MLAWLILLLQIITCNSIFTDNGRIVGSTDDFGNNEQCGYMVFVRDLDTDENLCSGMVIGDEQVLIATSSLQNKNIIKNNIRVVGGQSNTNFTLHSSFRKIQNITKDGNLWILQLETPFDLKDPYISKIPIVFEDNLKKKCVSGRLDQSESGINIKYEIINYEYKKIFSGDHLICDGELFAMKLNQTEFIWLHNYTSWIYSGFNTSEFKNPFEDNVPYYPLLCLFLANYLCSNGDIIKKMKSASKGYIFLKQIFVGIMQKLLGDKLLAPKNDTKSNSLHNAVISGKLNNVRRLIKKGANPNNLDSNGFSCMDYAVKGGFIGIIEYLLKKKITDINNKNGYSLTPLHLAVINGNLDAIKILIDAGADPRCTNKEKFTCLHFAAKNGNLKIIEYLTTRFSDIINVKNKFGTTPLQCAVQGQLAAVHYLVNKGADLKCVDYNQSACIHYSATGTTDIIQYLISNGDNINTENYFGHTPLHIAVTNDKLKIVKFLIDKGANPMCVDNNDISCLHIAAEKGFLDIVKYFIGKHFKDVNIKSALGTTPLHYAVKNDLQTVKYLIKIGGDLTIVDCGGFTCLHYAARAGNKKVVQYIISNSKKLDINVRSNLGVTPLQYAVNGNLETVQFLLEQGADVNITDINGSNCLHYAANIRATEIFKYLKDRNVNNLDVPNCFGITPII